MFYMHRLDFKFFEIKLILFLIKLFTKKKTAAYNYNNYYRKKMW